MLEISGLVINVGGVITAAIASVIVGSLWYGPLFGKLWMKEMGMQKPESMSPEAKQKMMQSYGITTVAAIVMAIVINQLVNILGSSVSWYMLTLILWLGFIVPTIALNSVLWEGKSWKLYGVNVLYYLVMIGVHAAIFTFWPL
jgi:hypothetical protein